jgi:hypothetical protein
VSSITGQTKSAGAYRCFSESSGRLTGMPVLGLMYPSFVLAADVDPRAWGHGRIHRTSADAAECWGARGACGLLLDDILSDAPPGEVDQRWYWARRPARSQAGRRRGDVVRSGTLRPFGVVEATLPGEEAADGQGRGRMGCANAARDMVNHKVALGRPRRIWRNRGLNAVAGPAVAALRALAR